MSDQEINIHQHKRNAIQVVITLGFMFSLYLTFTNLVYLSVSFFLLVPLLLVSWPNIFLHPIHKFHFYFLFFLFFVIASQLAYHPTAFAQFDFYRRDGNIFISWMPILILGATSIKFNVKKILKIFLFIMTVVAVIAYLKGGKTKGTYHLFFIAHNAAGGFTSIILALSVGFYLVRRNIYWLAVCLANSFVLYATYSRGSMLAVMAAFAAVVFNGKFSKTVLYLSIFASALLMYFAFQEWDDLGRPLSIGFNVEGIDAPEVERSGTIVARAVYAWPRAFENFINSPLYGHGFSSYDDGPYSYKEVIEGWLYHKDTEIIQYTDAHAHHSFYNILAELGIIGFVLCILMLFYLHKFIRNECKDPGLKQALLMAFWVVIYSSYTEHRLTTPSQMLPFTIIIGFVLSNYYHERKQKKRQNSAVIGDKQSNSNE